MLNNISCILYMNGYTICMYNKLPPKSSEFPLVWPISPPLPLKTSMLIYVWSMHIGIGIFLLRGVIRKGGKRVLYELFWNGQKGVNFTENINLKKILKFCWHLNSYDKNIDLFNNNSATVLWLVKISQNFLVNVAICISVDFIFWTMLTTMFVHISGLCNFHQILPGKELRKNIGWIH